MDRDEKIEQMHLESWWREEKKWSRSNIWKDVGQEIFIIDARLLIQAQ